jgi:hypothetical protein
MDFTRLIRDKMKKERLMFVYRGVVTNENSVSLLMLLEKEMESSDFNFVARKRLFMFVLESLQNVSRHSKVQEHADMSLVVYSKTDTGYTVTTGNVIADESTADLKGRLEEINHIDSKDIRNVYRKMLNASELSKKGGAGLGLIEMAKKTGNRLDFDFIRLDENYSYFVLSKTVDSGGVGMHVPGEKGKFTGELISQLERLMAENNVNLIWSGHMSPDIGKEVISFTETKLTEGDVEAHVRRKVFSVLVEILENVAKYSPGIEAEGQYGMPIAMIRLEGTVFCLTTGNLILKSRVEQLREKLDLINQYDKVGLKELFRKSLSGQDIDVDSTGNMGLIDMARKSGSKLEYEFDTVNETYSYYMLTVKVEGQEN